MPASRQSAVSRTRVDRERRGRARTQPARDTPARATFARLNQVPIMLAMSGVNCLLLYWGLNPDNCNDAGPHAHSFYEACYVHRGTGSVRIDGRTHRLKEGQVFLLRPDQVHRISSGVKDPMAISFWAFSLEKDNKLDRNDAGLERLIDRFVRSKRVVCNQGERVRQLLGLLAAEAEERGPAHFATVQSLTRALMCQTFRAFDQSTGSRRSRFSEGKNHAAVGHESSSNAASDSDHESNIGPVARARLFLHDNFMRPITVAQVAGHVHMGERQLARLFKRELSESVGKYLQKVRLEAAGRMLLEQGLSIKAIAARAGYPDVAYFTALFKKSTGMTPGEYRSARGSVYPLRAARPGRSKPGRSRKARGGRES
jgi:AraC family L-rhamnose operon transcriptional activator RhaR